MWTDYSLALVVVQYVCYKRIYPFCQGFPLDSRRPPKHNRAAQGGPEGNLSGRGRPQGIAYSGVRVQVFWHFGQ